MHVARQSQSCKNILFHQPGENQRLDLRRKRSYKCNRISSLRARRLKGNGKGIVGAREGRKAREWSIRVEYTICFVFHIYQRDVKVMM